METKFISRRDLLKGTGVLIVSFSFFGRVSNALAQGDGLSVDGMDPTVLDSWMAIARAPTVTSNRRWAPGRTCPTAKVVAESPQ